MAEVLSRIKLEVAQRRVRPKEFFLDFDQLRKGEVSEAQFRRALSMMNLNLTATDLDAVCALFHLSSGLLNYRQFLQDVDSVFHHETEASPVKVAKQQLSPAQLTADQHTTHTGQASLSGLRPI
jgi:hypothetical protein